MTTHEAYKAKLEEELASVLKELKSIGRVNPDNPMDWEPTPENLDIDNADSNIVADKFEGFEENNAIMNQIENRYNEVKAALERIEKGAYGICEVGGEPIEPERLDANPAATTCEKHMGGN
jgi:RNA polymerase-binding transcription factor DksA